MLRADVALSRGDFELDAAVAVAPGERLALVGPSGAGKSTLLRTLAGLVRPDGGRIELDGTTWFDSEAGVAMPPERRGVGLVFQEYALFPRMSAWRNVGYGIRGGSRAQRRERAHELLERFGLAARSDARPHDLSGGERQRVALARALASEPQLLLLDEPLSALDATTRGVASAELSALLATMAIPAVIVTHDFTEAALLADRVAVIDRGRVVQEGTPAELAATPASAFVADLAGAVVLRGVAAPTSGGLTRVELEGGGAVLSTDSRCRSRRRKRLPLGDRAARAGAGRRGLRSQPPPGGGDWITQFGNRARVALALPQPAVAEVTSASVARLDLRAGAVVEASWKATATRLSPLR